MEFDELSNKVIGCAIEVHKILGPELLENVYEQCMCRELKLRNIDFENQVIIPVKYKGVQLDCGYRIDLLIEDNIIIELKSVDKLIAIHSAQLLTYMKLKKIKIGLLVNFNSEVLYRGIKRLVL